MQSGLPLTGQRYIDFDFLRPEPAASRAQPALPRAAQTRRRSRSSREKAGISWTSWRICARRMLETWRGDRSARELLGSPEVKGAFTSADRAFKNVDPC